ncbi:hypothetical protein [Cryobacterium zhongshanensis]|uniref:Uncharacterized protein n=1 Tax=Cryobacterium zhongshanensis TaxID=2928153 RepID=A0AA41QXN9_9MICO|nr:hypothetical protein [Cryobacterium zhongshanensis]MCI4659537.1 hypothetical protein [Cryobacterium zhongshanensis]
MSDKTGTSIAEGLGGIAILMILTLSVTLGITTDMNAVQTLSVKAERQALVTSLVADKREGATWGTKAAPSTQTITLPNGRNVPVTLWRDVTPGGSTLTAVTAISAGPDAANCSGPSAVEKNGCIYAARFHAGDLGTIAPYAIISKDPSTAPAAPTGTVDSRVSTATAIPQGTVFATGTDAKATVWRYLINAQSIEPVGEMRITQGGVMLALIPVDSSSNGNYFGTFSAALNVPVTATITQGNVVVQTVYFYRAGGTS